MRLSWEGHLCVCAMNTYTVRRAICMREEYWWHFGMCNESWDSFVYVRWMLRRTFLCNECWHFFFKMWDECWDGHICACDECWEIFHPCKNKWKYLQTVWLPTVQTWWLGDVNVSCEEWECPGDHTSCNRVHQNLCSAFLSVVPTSSQHELIIPVRFVF